MIDTKCTVCQRNDEDCGHIFFKCKIVKSCWRLLDMEDIRSILVSCQSGIETILKICKLEKINQMKVIVFLWRWWSARNKANEGERMLFAAEIQSSV